MRGETYLENRHWFCKPLEIERAHWIRRQSASQHKFAHGRRNSDGSGRRHSAQPSRQLHRGPEQIASLCNRLPDADANTEVDGMLSTSFRRRKETCMSIADSTAADTDVNEAMIPSPVCFTSRPPCFCNVARTISSCSRRRRIKPSSPSCWVCCVESQRSVNRMTRTADSTYASPAGCRGISPRNAFMGPSPTSMMLSATRPCASRCTVFQRLSIRPLGETKHVPSVFIEPISDITDLVLVLNGKVEFVRGGDVDGRRTRRLVSIKEQGHVCKAKFKGDSV